MAVLRGPVGEINTQAKFDETVNNEEVQCMACDWIQEILTASSEG
jgi:hypothetical protein